MPSKTPAIYLTPAGIDALQAILQQWIKDERQYRAQVTEARTKELPYACMMGHADGLRQARHAIQRGLGLVVSDAENERVLSQI